MPNARLVRMRIWRRRRPIRVNSTSTLPPPVPGGWAIRPHTTRGNRYTCEPAYMSHDSSSGCLLARSPTSCSAVTNRGSMSTGTSFRRSSTVCTGGLMTASFSIICVASV